VKQRDQQTEGCPSLSEPPCALDLNEVTSHFPHSPTIVELGRPPSSQGPLGQCSPLHVQNLSPSRNHGSNPPLCSPPKGPCAIQHLSLTTPKMSCRRLLLLLGCRRQAVCCRSRPETALDLLCTSHQDAEVAELLQHLLLGSCRPRATDSEPPGVELLTPSRLLNPSRLMLSPST